MVGALTMQKNAECPQCIPFHSPCPRKAQIPPGKFQAACVQDIARRCHEENQIGVGLHFQIIVPIPQELENALTAAGQLSSPLWKFIAEHEAAWRRWLCCVTLVAARTHHAPLRNGRFKTRVRRIGIIALRCQKCA